MSRSQLSHAPCSEPVLIYDQLSKEYVLPHAVISVLNQINWSLNQSELGMIIGPSGSGKTTLLMIAGGLVPPDTGQCRVLNNNIYALSAADKTQFIAKHIGFVFQRINLFSSLSAIENIALPLIVDGMRWDEALPKAEELMILFDLKQHLSSPIQILSGGQKQRIAIARAIIRSPNLIICDEPTSNLDKKTALITLEIMKRCAIERICTFLISTHDPQIFGKADKILELS